MAAIGVSFAKPFNNIALGGNIASKHPEYPDFGPEGNQPIGDLTTHEIAEELIRRLEQTNGIEFCDATRVELLIKLLKAG
jgi:hypothetical protein